MIDRIKRIPELRFSNFYNEWQEKKLGDLGKTYTGLSGKTKTDFGFGDSHFITYMNVFKNNIAKFEMTEKVKISNNEKQNKVNYGDIFFTTSSEVPQEVGMTSIWLFKTNNVYLNSFCFGFRITINNVLPIFLARYLRSENIRKKITILAQGSTRFNLSKKEVMKLSINFPEINEQQKIGDFFSKLDRQIELEEQKLAKLEEQKKGYMQKLFSQEIRFKDNQGNNYPDWKIVEIGDILEERTERSGEGDMLSVTINNGIIKFDEIDRKDNSSKDKSNYRKVYKDDIAYNSMRMWQGASGKSEYEGIVSPAYTVTIPSENINPDFIAYYFKTHKMIHKFKINSQGLTSDTWNLKYRQLKDIKLNLCSKEEQNKIANLLIMYDKLINKQKHKLEILKTNKKGFLQKMFV
ncbi:TPA: restriction endonuclease subunit S [Escherichia coli]|nr:restriction endonuclease subunit S [Escherichia coli]